MTSLTEKQQELLNRLLDSDAITHQDRTFSFDIIDKLWYRNSDYTTNTLKSFIKKGFCSRVKWETSFLSSKFAVRYHFPTEPFSCNIDAIKNNREYYDVIYQHRRTYEAMLKSSKTPSTVKQEEMLSVLQKKFESSPFTRKDLDLFYWDHLRGQNKPRKQRVNTFAHQLIHLVGKGKLTVLEGTHLHGKYLLEEITDQKLLRRQIYKLSLGLISEFNNKMLEEDDFRMV